MSSEYVNNHYVPQWYQRRFIPADDADNELHYLDLRPGTFTDPRGVKHKRKAERRQGFRKCFAQNDLYTTRLRGVESREIEKVFFGTVDSCGKRAVEYFSSFAHPSVDATALNDLLLYLSTQKLRTPKGLDWLAEQMKETNRDRTLQRLVGLQTLFGAVWAECVWQIANADESATKFIVTDHPVTVYNRACGPRSQFCRGANDPDVRLLASHTLFPLDMNRALILTNRSWAQNPYQPEKRTRENPDLVRGAMFNFMEIQSMRQLSEREVLEINFILKSRAYRFIGAAEEHWLYPERVVSKSDWNTYGHGYLFMPDPRPLNTGSEFVVSYSDGSIVAMDDHGRTPENRRFGGDSKMAASHAALNRFKAEFSGRFGPRRRGLSFDEGHLDPACDSDEVHRYHLGLNRRSS